MNKRNGLIVFIAFLFSICVVLSACAKEPKTDEDTDISYTLMIYMCGSDLESVRGYASGNISAMLAADLPDGASVIIQTGGTREWHDERIPDAKSARFEVKSEELRQVGETFDANMGEAETLSDFISFGKTSFPAQKYSLILWDHGTGSNGGVCYDELYGNDCLSLPEIEKAISQSGVSFEFVGFDACLMATYDVVLLLKEHADFLVGSQELEPGSGWNYSALVSLGKDSFYNDLLAGYAQKHSSSTYYTLSVIDLTKSAKIAALMEGICSLIRTSPNQLAVALNGMQFGAGERGQGNSGLFDMREFAYNLGMNNIDFSDVINTVNGSARQSAFGLSIFFPKNEDQLETYRDVCADYDYFNTLHAYFTEKPEGDAVRFEQRGFVFDNKLSFTLTEDSLKYVRSVRYELHIFSNDPEQQFLYSIGTDNDISRASAMYTVNFEGRWVWLGNHLLHCSVYEESNGSTLFSARVRIDGKDSLLLFEYNNRSMELTVEGYIELEADGSRILPLAEGMAVEILYYDALADMYIVEDMAIWGIDELSISDLPAATYQIVPIVTDIYGYEYDAYTAAISFDGNTVTNIEISAG